MLLGDGNGASVSYEMTWTTASNYAVQFIEVDGAAIGDGIDGIAVGLSLSTNPVAPTVTPKGVDDLLVSVYSGNAANVITVPGSQTLIAGSQATGPTSTSAGEENLTSNAATGTRTATAASMNWRAWNILFAGPTSSGILLPSGWTNAPGPVYADPGAISGAPTPVVFGGANSSPSRGHPKLNHGQWSGNASFVGTGFVGLRDTVGFSGNHKIVGTGALIVTSDGLPAARRIYLFPRTTPSILVGETWSRDDGTYEFLNIRAGVYDVLGVDWNDVQNNVTRALIQSIPM
jgi:hypothetical protein